MVCRRGERIALANWVPESFIGQIFRTLAHYIQPVPGVQSPMRWGTEDGLQALFSNVAHTMQMTPRTFVFRYRSPDHWLEVFHNYF